MSGPILYGGGWYTTVEKGLHQRCVLALLLFNILFAAFINVSYTRFKVVKDIGTPRRPSGVVGNLAY